MTTFLKRHSRALWCALAAALLLPPPSSSAQNPVIRDQYSADPTAHVFGDRVYLYPSHDIISPVAPERRWFAMADYHVFSSTDLTDWTDHGVILDQKQVPWANHEGYAMWAPDCVEHHGRYYLFFPSGLSSERGFGIGIATAPSPIGPFTPAAKPLDGVRGIDPCMLQTSRGESYLFWAGNGGITVARMNDDYQSLAEAPKTITGLPEGFKEGPFVFERNGLFYLTFPWVRQKNGTETLAYAMSKSPEGPYTFKGIIMDEWPDKCWTNHHSIVQYRGQWYLFYHHNDYSPSFDKCRSVRIDSLNFRPDGTIVKVEPTLRGVGLTDARRHIEIDRYSSISSTGAQAVLLDSLQPFRGWALRLNRQGWARYNRVAFRPGLCRLTLRARAQKPSTVAVTIGSQCVARLNIAPCDSFSEQTVSINPVAAGTYDIKAQLEKGSNADVDWLAFEGKPISPYTQGGMQTGRYRNYFAEMGYVSEDIDRRVNDVFQEVFFGPNRVYFEVGDSLGYISDLKNHDVRTEGMSYGMMIAVEMNRKDIFDRLLRWAQRYMLMRQGPLAGYYAWSCKTDGTHNAEGPASDGELYMITSLIFASNRWGNQSGIDYLAEAQRLLRLAREGNGRDSANALINPQHRLITFTPSGFGARFTDPSYHLPAFYEVWARWADDGHADYYKACAAASRRYLHRCIDPRTALCPDVTAYDGKPLTPPGNRPMKGNRDFRYDSWRMPMNIALDYSWACADTAWQRRYANTVQDFFFNKGIDAYVDQYRTDGMAVERPIEGGGKTGLRHSVGLVSTLAAASLAADHAKARDFADRLWHSTNVPFADGYFDAYYDGLLRLFAFMHLSGKYRVIAPGQ
jgi:oligosaccharide reducing-end xylanase